MTLQFNYQLFGYKFITGIFNAVMGISAASSVSTTKQGYVTLCVEELSTDLFLVSV